MHVFLMKLFPLTALSIESQVWLVATTLKGARVSLQHYMGKYCIHSDVCVYVCVRLWHVLTVGMFPL